jgi:glycerol-3-phosphate acyltransferase PlsY
VDLSAVGAVIAGYLIGSVDFGVIVPRLAGVDIYREGSGNPGATNVLRTMGRPAAALVMAGDLLKGIAAGILGNVIDGPVLGFAVGFAAVAGHCFPIWHRFKGGKGVATAGGMVFAIEPILGAILLVGWGLLATLLKRASPASILLALAVVPALYGFGHRGWALTWAGAAAALVLVRHRANIRRLLGGSEHRIER